MNHFLINVLMVLILAGNSKYPVHGQIILKNPSFEDETADATLPGEWWSCQRETTPDILPGSWGVYNMPADGSSYIGLITREDGSYESIGQRLDIPLNKKQCYQWNVSLAHSDTYAGYTSPIRFSIYLGDKKCDMRQLIFTSPVIEKKMWESFDFNFTPEFNAHYITILANDQGKQVNGNILIDGLGVIEECDRADLIRYSSPNVRW